MATRRSYTPCHKTAGKNLISYDNFRIRLLGLHVEWSGRGADGGRDLICRETLAGQFASQTRTWLVQCKHKAHSGNSVGISDLDDIVTSCTQHNATGYLLACSTQPSSGVISRLEGISNNANNSITAVCWDAVTIERQLSQPKQWAIAQRFMPNSCGAWKIYATESPNNFVAHFKGYVFQLTNRIGSQVGHHMTSIANRISEIEAIDLPSGHFIRPRAIWYDDKGAHYSWYIDYMHPHDQKPAVSKAYIRDTLHEDWALEDGQIYSWDIRDVEYTGWSDHYDEDHYDYYTRYLPNFLEGTPRQDEINIRGLWATKQEIELFEKDRLAKAKESFEELKKAFEKVPYLRLKRAVNCNPEVLWKSERRFDWSDLLVNFDLDTDNIFTATLMFDVFDQTKFFNLLERFPQSVNRHFRASRVYVFLPDKGLDTEDDELQFDVKFMIHPSIITNQHTVRKEFNTYFDDIRTIVEEEIL